MYRTFFELTKDPFSMTADPEFLMFTPQHREALAGLAYSIMARRGIAVLSGDVGTGKTTILTKALQLFASTGVRTSVILNPILNPAEFMEAVLLGFGIEQFPESKTLRLRVLEQFLTASGAAGKTAALIVDEAHALPAALLEEIRLLGNFEYKDQKLLQILLVGQNELDGILNCENLRQLKQRIALRFTIGPLGEAEVGKYISYRWAQAGGPLPVPFSAAAIAAVWKASGGFPRLINAVCDNALLLALGESSKTVTDQHVVTASVDLHLSQKKSSFPVAPTAEAENKVNTEPVAFSPPPAVLPAVVTTWAQVAICPSADTTNPVPTVAPSLETMRTIADFSCSRSIPLCDYG